MSVESVAALLVAMFAGGTFLVSLLQFIRAMVKDEEKK